MFGFLSVARGILRAFGAQKLVWAEVKSGAVGGLGGAGLLHGLRQSGSKGVGHRLDPGGLPEDEFDPDDQDGGGAVLRLQILHRLASQFI